MPRGCRTINHGLSHHPLHRRWKAMKERCYYPKNKVYSYYGGKGITICDDWKNNFMAFYEWAMSNGWDESLTLDRIDVNGDYCPENCRWISMKEQCHNRTNNVYITIDGVTKLRMDWCEEYGISVSTFRHRLERGMTPIDALTEPIHKNQFV